jgi:hypothetical protein
MVLFADVDFLKMGRIVAAFLKIVRIFLNEDVVKLNLGKECVRGNKTDPPTSLEKSAIKLENRRESALILEKGLCKKSYLNTHIPQFA